ncbi:MAG: immunoglobulin domain-containing protein [Planctomycetota bacterium]
MQRNIAIRGLCLSLFFIAVMLSGGCHRKLVPTSTGHSGSAPTITTQPTNVTTSVGLPATFTVVATGSGDTYQWQKGGTAIGGATSATYTIATSALTDAGSYDVVVTNTGGSVTSNTVTLTVNPVGFPAITTQPTNQTVSEPNTATFTVVASGTATLSYQWYRGSGTGTPVGTNSASYTTGATTVAGDNGAQFHVVVTNGLGSVDSNLATLTVNPPGAPTITTQPTNQSVVVGGSATFTVVASGSGLTYQWYKGVTAIGGATGASYTINPAALTDAGSYTVKVTNGGGSVTSNPATLTVTKPYTGNPITGAPATLTLPTAPAASSTPVSATFTVTNSWGTPVTVTITGGAGWLSGSPTPILIAPGASQVITVTGDPAVGSGTANLTLTNSPGGQTATVAVTFAVSGTSAATASIVAPMQDAAISTSVTLDGSATTGATSYQWTQIAGPTVTLTGATTNTATFTAPATVPAQSLQFELAATGASGPASFAIATVTVYEAIGSHSRIFVDPTSGSASDTNTLSGGGPNSKSLPMKTLSAALNDAINTGYSPLPDIYMSAGTDSTSAAAGSFGMHPGISIYGGFEDTNWTRNVTANTTTISNGQVVTGSNAVTFDNNGQAWTAADIIDGLTFTGGSGDFAMTVSLGACAPTFRNDTIVGGTGTNGDCECVRVNSSGNSPTFDNCKFQLGTNTSAGIADCIGVLINNSGLASFNDCTFSGGTPNGQIHDLKLTTTATTPIQLTGCTFDGTGTPGSNYNAIYDSRCPLALSKCYIAAGTSSSGSRALYGDFRDTSAGAATSTITIDRCVMLGGSGTANAHAILVTEEAASANALSGPVLTVTNSYLRGGSGVAENCAVEAYDNGVTTGFTNPIRLTLTNNTIDTGNAGTLGYGVYLHGSASPGVKLSAQNNILFTTQSGGSGGKVELIAEETAAGINTPTQMQNNLFFIDTAYTGTPDYYFIRGTPNVDIAPPGTLDLTNATSINTAITATTKSGNINLTTAEGVANSTVFASTAPFDYHLLSGTSPAIDAGLNAGAPAVDIDGEARPNGSNVDIGCDEN